MKLSTHGLAIKTIRWRRVEVHDLLKPELEAPVVVFRRQVDRQKVGQILNGVLHATVEGTQHWAPFREHLRSRVRREVPVQRNEPAFNSWEKTNSNQKVDWFCSRFFHLWFRFSSFSVLHFPVFIDLDPWRTDSCGVVLQSLKDYYLCIYTDDEWWNGRLGSKCFWINKAAQTSISI